MRQLATLLCALPAVPPGQMACPNAPAPVTGCSFAWLASRGFGEVTVDLSGCRVVTGLGPARSPSMSTALQQALSQHFGIHFPLAP